MTALGSLGMAGYRDGLAFLARERPAELRATLRMWATGVAVAIGLCASLTLDWERWSAVILTCYGLLGVAAYLPTRSALAMLREPAESFLTIVTILFPLWACFGIVIWFLIPFTVPVATIIWAAFLVSHTGGWAAVRIAIVCILGAAVSFIGAVIALTPTRFELVLLGSPAIGWHCVMAPVLLCEVGRKLATQEFLRNSCPSCTYDLRGLPPGAVCPECGASPVPSAGA